MEYEDWGSYKNELWRAAWRKVHDFQNTFTETLDVCSYSSTSTATQQHLHTDDTATRAESSAQNISLVLWKDPFGFVTAELTQNKENKSESTVALQRALQLRK